MLVHHNDHNRDTKEFSKCEQICYPNSSRSTVLAVCLEIWGHFTCYRPPLSRVAPKEPEPLPRAKSPSEDLIRLEGQAMGKQAGKPAASLLHTVAFIGSSERAKRLSVEQLIEEGATLSEASIWNNPSSALQSLPSPVYSWLLITAGICYTHFRGLRHRWLHLTTLYQQLSIECC